MAAIADFRRSPEDDFLDRLPAFDAILICGLGPKGFGCPRVDERMDNLHDVGSYLAQSTFLQLQLCLKALDLMGCTMAAISVANAIDVAREELERKAPSSHSLFRPDEDFSQMDAMAAEIFAGKYGRPPF